MARRFSASQIKSKLRQAQQKTKQAIDKYNQAARRYNSGVRQAVNKYNQEVRAHNSRVRANRQRVKSELEKLSRQSTTTRYVVFRTSVRTMHDAYNRLEQRAEALPLDPQYNQVLDLSEREVANSLGVMNSLLGVQPESAEPAYEAELQLTNELRKISTDLDDRWRGAVYSLSPQNPDAARHFCTSAREILTQILEIKAPDHQVAAVLPSCDFTNQGKPTRRAKIKFFLHQKGMLDDTLEDFVEEDMENIIELFQVFNDGTHGSAGKFDLSQLSAIKRRVEDGILFLTSLVN